MADWQAAPLMMVFIGDGGETGLINRGGNDIQMPVRWLLDKTAAPEGVVTPDLFIVRLWRNW